MKIEKSPLNAYNAIYEALIDSLLPNYLNSDTERELIIINAIASFAWFYHPGRFVDYRLEHHALNIGQRLWNRYKQEVLDTIPKVSSNRRRVLHVVTETYDVGGHTKLLLNLIINDDSSTHSIIITRHTIQETPKWLIDAVTATGGTVVSLAGESYTKRVELLQYQLVTQADKIFYHIHPDDCIAVAALAAVPRPPVMAVNHADHIFWLGAATVDVVVCIREWSEEFSLSQRGAQQVALLPIPLNFLPTENNYKVAARKQLGIADDSTLILSVAGAYKFIPSGEYNFFKTIIKVLEKNKDVYVKIIGVSEADDLEKLQYIPHPRMELLGIVKQPQIYYQAADIYVDSMPFSSFTSLFEAIYFECFPVLQYNPVGTLSVDQEPAYKGLVMHAVNEQSQLECIQEAIKKPLFRKEIAHQCSQRIRSNYMMPGWRAYLQALYDRFPENVSHVRDLKPLLSKSFVFTQDSVDAANLSNSFYELDGESLLVRLRNILPVLESKDILTLYFSLKSKVSEIGFGLSLRQTFWLLRAKLRNSFL